MQINCYYFFLSYLQYIMGYNVDIYFPIIYKDLFRANYGRSSYFGYSVLLNKYWIQIGAPRANLSREEGNAVEPGSALHCKFHGPCVKLSLGKFRSKNQFSVSKESWFGVAMDFQPGAMGSIVVCGHRWTNASVSKGIPGACYSFHPNENLKNISTILTPMSSEDRDKIYFLDYANLTKPIKERKILAYKYALSQYGMSIHFSKTAKGKNSFLFGAPGYLNWKGTVVKCKSPETCSKEPTVIKTDHSIEIDNFDLFGYQVSSGHFFSDSELLYVAGAPRDLSMKGYVMLFKLTENDSKLEKVHKIQGETTGEYFGSSIAVADITGDNLDDLVVGAPFFTRIDDEGCIYVYVSHKDKTLKKMEGIVGRKEKGRFGTAVASLGDIDHDGFADIAVGAPYEGNGAIYIYYGRHLGLKGPVQRISAEDIHKSLKGFGISFSGQADIDSNRYDDVAVGSFLSGHAVILRTYPVVSVNARFIPDTQQLSDIIHEAKINVCLKFTGTRVNTLNVTRKILADRSYGRAKPPSVLDTVILNNNITKCKQFIFNVKFNADLVLHSMEFLLTAFVTNTSDSSFNKQPLFVKEDGKRFGEDGFNRQDPVQRKSDGKYEDALYIPYSQGCASEICKTDLQVAVFLLENGKKFDFSSQPFIVGSLADYKLKIVVTNSGEPSYSTKVVVKFPNGISLSKYDCDEMEDSFVCQLGHIRNNSKKVVTLDLTISYDQHDINIDHKLLINVSVNTTAKDINMTNNYGQITLNLSFDVDVYLYGNLQKDNYRVIKLDDGSVAPFVEVVQTYEVLKKGVSPLKALELELNIPVNLTSGMQELQVLSLNKPEAIIDGKYWYCSVNFACIDCQSISREIDVGEDSVTETDRLKRSLLKEDLPKAIDLPVNRTFYINCLNEFVKCAQVKCEASELEVYGKVTLRLHVNIAELGPLMGQKDIIHITSKGQVKLMSSDISKVKNIQPPWSHTAEVSSTIIGQIFETKVDLWIIIASVIGGILLAMLVALGLAKTGFFQRQKREKLEELKEKSRNSQLEPLPSASSMNEEFDGKIELRQRNTLSIE